MRAIRCCDYITSPGLLRFVGLDGDQHLAEVAAFVDNYTTGRCSHADKAFSTCRSHALGDLPHRADDKWVRELEPWELYVTRLGVSPILFRPGACRVPSPFRTLEHP